MAPDLLATATFRAGRFRVWGLGLRVEGFGLGIRD